MDFGHVWTAMVTPFDSLGNVDIDKTRKLIDYLLDRGTDALVIAGTTGESPTLTEEEKISLFQLAVKHVNKRAAVIAGTGSNNTAQTIKLTKEAAEAGVDGVMLVTPYYNKPSQQGLYDHFHAAAASTKLPVMLYNVPGRTSVNLEAETVIKLSEIENITAVKEASGDLEQMAAIIEGTAEDFFVYSGDDSLTIPALAIGADGIVSVVSHVAGKQMQQMIQSFIAGDVVKAGGIHRKLLPVMKAMFHAPNPTCVKYALQVCGLDTGGVRLPLVPLTTQEQQVVKTTIEESNL
ncbi:4-hydroxy-tetrahydrodipicolinate synthase [Alkalihalophilus marmarensis]|jgi:4-hydroxy-tetrahydrodipicolinate synthase|uniref:4-hydroxy-tetrahydrodipicolinate synthase n=1 Tax=Alkalihalophilus marmarensis DSM 21297 TaxID=1188261 RepID=U6SNU8_9BACI|nr:4-hydroxy-tetrahydrodipicolinate synthase [Alkalihalophilus marmarensis]ERN53369.1 dihydrodipicolinate synthase [Alkalihalophilus marmarensis DSM 21297]MCM3489526.1 4-hydroxy-tetrahydrodipicolinate synthase [Alkalihalophilus marmarensis]